MGLSRDRAARGLVPQFNVSDAGVGFLPAVLVTERLEVRYRMNEFTGHSLSAGLRGEVGEIREVGVPWSGGPG